jgi:hypothetical protein
MNYNVSQYFLIVLSTDIKIHILLCWDLLRSGEYLTVNRFITPLLRRN